MLARRAAHSTLALISFAALAVLPARPAPSSTTWYVDANAAAGGDGSRLNPFQTIQEGLDVAAPGELDTVLVLPGVYVENVDFLNKRVALVSELGPDVTTIDGGQNGSVVRITGPIDWGNDVALTGFTLTNGSGEDYLGLGGVGGGLLIADTSPRIEDCVLVSNQAVFLGGGIYAENSAALVRDCTIDSNDATSYALGSRGGGVHAPASVVLDGCEIRSNFAIVFGGGVRGATLTDCVIENNFASIGGGLHQSTATDSTLRDNLAFSVDYSLDIGGGAAESTLTGCLLEDNHANTWGGAASHSTLADCVVRRNTVSFNYDYSGSKGSGTYKCDLTGCAVYQNQLTLGSNVGLPPSRGGGAYGGTATRTAFYENSADIGAGVFGSSLEHAVVFNNAGGGVIQAGPVHNSVVFSNWVQVEGSSGVTYSNIEGGYPGTGNIDMPPGFWAPFGAPSGEGHDFHLKPGSPCIDAGDPSSPLDPDGSIADIGVFPFDPGWCVEPVTYCTAKTNSLGCVPAISAAGSPSLGQGPLLVSATQVLNNKNGLLFWGVDSLAGPFQGGIKCVAAPTRRTAIQNSGGNPPPNDCSGTYSFSFDAAYLALQGLGPGQEVHAQFWSRDPQSHSTTGLTDAVWFIVCP